MELFELILAMLALAVLLVGVAGRLWMPNRMLLALAGRAWHSHRSAST